MQRHDCGSCTLCCHLTEVPEIAKPVYHWCEFCKPGSGCTVYDMRPQSCRSFQCHWLKSDMDDELRPDKCGVLIEDLSQHSLFLALVEQGRPDAWKEPALRQVFSSLSEQGFAVVVSVEGGQRQFVLVPHGKTESEVVAAIRQAKEAIHGFPSIYN